MNKVKKAFRSYSDVQLLAVGEKIDTCIPNSPLYDSIHPATDVFKTALSNYRIKLAAAADGGKLAIASKNEAREELIRVLTLWASYIEDHADDNESSIVATGFELAQKPTQGTVPTTPENVHLLDGKLSGSAEVRYKKVSNATAYEIRWRKESDDVWQLANLAFKAHSTLHDIARGTVIWVQVRAVNTHGNSNWSDPATIMVR